MTETVNHPAHYNAHPSGVECIDVVRLMPFTTGNAVKYIWRADLKNGVEDLRKARWYLRDHLANGMASCPPFKARELLRKVAEADTDHVRARLLAAVAGGELGYACVLITEIVGDGGHD